MILDNVSALAGGGLYITGGNTTISDSTISENESTTSSGGGIWLNISAATTAVATIERSVISANIASIRGGGISAQNSNLQIHDSAITGNSALSATLGYGGGIDALIGADVLVTGSLVEGNSATRAGAEYPRLERYSIIRGEHNPPEIRPSSAEACLANKSVAAVSDSTISGNTAVRGGGIYQGDVSKYPRPHRNSKRHPQRK